MSRFYFCIFMPVVKSYNKIISSVALLILMSVCIIAFTHVCLWVCLHVCINACVVFAAVITVGHYFSSAVWDYCWCHISQKVQKGAIWQVMTFFNFFYWELKKLKIKARKKKAQPFHHSMLSTTHKNMYHRLVVTREIITDGKQQGQVLSDITGILSLE